MRIGLFPGQGIHASEVEQALRTDPTVVNRASELLGYPLLRHVQRSIRGRRRALPTWLAQPAIFVAGISGRQRHFKSDPVTMYAGHSLGEYTALVASGAISFKHGLRLVALRGKVMHKAAIDSPGGMVAVLGLSLMDVREIASKHGATVSNDNAPEQVVLSGSDDALSQAAAAAKARGARAIKLEVTGAFHSAAMEPAAGPLEDALTRTEIRSPRVPVISNVTARPYRSPGEIRSLLVRQMTEPVLFADSLRWAWGQGARTFLDLGPGTVVGGLARATFGQLEDRETVDA